MRIPIALSVLAAAAGLAAASPAPAQIVAEAPAVRPDAIVDLATPAGVALVKGQWRYSDVKVVEVDHRSPGPDLKPSGPSNRTYDISPHAGGATFDDSQWETLDPATLAARRS